MARRIVYALLVGIGIALVGLCGLALLFGPQALDTARQFFRPFTTMIQAERDLHRLETEIPFTPPEDGRIPEDRLQAFLRVRQDLLPLYRQGMT